MLNHLRGRQVCHTLSRKLSRSQVDLASLRCPQGKVALPWIKTQSRQSSSSPAYRPSGPLPHHLLLCHDTTSRASSPFLASTWSWSLHFSQALFCNPRELRACLSLQGHPKLLAEPQSQGWDPAPYLTHFTAPTSTRSSHRPLLLPLRQALTTWGHSGLPGSHCCLPG